MSESSDYIENWLALFKEDKNKFRLFTFETASTSSELIANICAKLQLPAEVEFTCLVNVDEYFQTYYRKIADSAQMSQGTNGGDIWTKALDDLEEHVILWTMNLIMICTKYSSSSVPISTMDFLSILNNCYRPCSLESFNENEFKVLRLLNFQIQPPVAYYSTMYYLEKWTQKCSISMKNAVSDCGDLLRISFLKRNEIYESVDADISCDIDKFRSDQTLLGQACVLTCFVINKSSTKVVCQLLHFLSEESRIPAKQILFLSSKIKSAVKKYAHFASPNEDSEENIL